MMGPMYFGVSASIFVGGCAFFKEEVFHVMPVLVMVSIGWPIIVAGNLIGFISDVLKN